MPDKIVAAKPLELGGLTPFSSVDFPGKLAAVVFCQGCPLRCPYCHNPHLQAFIPGTISWTQALAFLQNRRGLLDAVVFSGGEPLAQAGLEAAMREVRALGFSIGLHTAGTHPNRLRRILPLVDWAGLDIKAPLADYPAFGGQSCGKSSFTALEELIRAKQWHEVRTTISTALFSAGQLTQLASELSARGVKKWVLQACRDNPASPPAAFPETLLRPLRAFIPEIVCR